MTPTLRPIAPTSGDREILTTRLAHARARTDELFALLSPDALYERPIPERHRLVFYLGHLEAFDANLLRQAYGLASFNPDFDKLFAFGIDPTDGGLPNEPPSAWPSPESIRAYNARVREAVDECLAGVYPIRPEYDEETILDMALEHRLMHAETLAYLLHRLPYEVKHGHADPPLRAPAGAARAESIRIPAGRATLGLERASGRFGWDNEFEARSVSVPEFSIDKHKVTNGRFLEFVEAGGYAERRFWSEDDWAWKEAQRLQHPSFWIRRGNEWLWRGMFAESPLDLIAPVYVSLAEASAFARWAGRSLPTEAQFHRAAYGTPGGPDSPGSPESREREYPWGDDTPASKHGNFDFQRWDPTPVGAHPAGASAFGVDEMVGNGWEWTSTPFGPFDGFRPHPLYAGYSADFFDGKHHVMKGGSPRTAACMLRRSFRNWFQPRYGYVYAAFRTVAA
jgi:iron(II)-dependent oxidoreductase